MPDAAVYGPPGLDRALGSLPVIASFLDQLNVAGAIDELCPVRDVALATHGQVIEAMIASRLTSPAPLARVVGWACAWAVGHCSGIAPEVLNDDRLGRALDAIAPHLDQIAGTIGARAITQFGVDVSRIHWDMTPISPYGAYEQAGEDYARPRFGHPQDRRPDLKQIQTGIGTSADGGIPVCHRACDGGAAEVPQVTGAMTALKDLAGRRRFLPAGDSRLISHPNVRGITAANVTFTAPAPRQHVPASVLAARGIGKAIPVDDTARRDAGKPAGDRGIWRVHEDTMVMSPPERASGPGITPRRIFVYSSARARAAQTARTRKPARATGGLDRLMRGPGSRHYPDEAAVRTRLAVTGKTRRVASSLKATAGTGATTGKPALTGEFDAQALHAEAATDGWYALLANLDAAHAGAADALIRFTGQEASERRYGNHNGPPAAAPLFLQHNRRTEALITVICLALLVFCLIERHIRAQIAPQTMIPGPYAGRPARPASWLIFLALAGMRLIRATGNRPAVIPQPTPLQQHLPELPGVDPLKPP